MKKKIAIIGGGACALMLACELDGQKYQVSVYEKNAALGRKFLVAGEGGLNLTHSENESTFISRYTPASFFKEAFVNFSNKELVKWINDLGIPIYVGSSGRVFPVKGIKPIDALNAILTKIKKNEVVIYTKYNWIGFSENGNLFFEVESGREEIKSDYVIFCLGGASWPVTGSKGEWVNYFEQKEIKINPFLASNCSFKINWENNLISKLEGKVLKNISIHCGNKTHLGEVVLTRFGIEGSGIYPLSPEIRSQLKEKLVAQIYIDLKPNLSVEKVREKLESRPLKINLTEYLKAELHLSDVMVLLLKHYVSKDDFLSNPNLSQHIKALGLTITDTGSIDDAISTTGGVALEEITNTFELKKLPHHFVIGEMLDYDAPTGGYLLQSCFSMGKWLATNLNSRQM